MAESGTKSRPVMVVAGARPNFMKVAPILRELDRTGVSRHFVHTGQHYDARLSADLLSDLGAPEPDVSLDVGSASHAEQTARVMQRFEPVLYSVRPRWLVLVGDVNSTLACALVGAKLRQELSFGIAHVEAGLRSGDWRMPEEVNRVLTDRLSDLLLLPSEDARENLRAEGLAGIRQIVVGNVMIDSLLDALPRARALDLRKSLGLLRPFMLVTLHRPSNVDEPERLAVLLAALERCAQELDVVFPLHPRTRRAMEASGFNFETSRVRWMEPVGYLTMVGLLDAATVVVTDSGGLQEESTVLGVPCLTVREQTERPITVAVGTNRMVDWPPSAENIVRGVRDAIERGRSEVGSCAPVGWDGTAAGRVVEALG